MHDDDTSQALKPEELEALRSLTHENRPAPELEDRVVEALSAHGLIRAPAWRRWAGLAAAASLILAAGFAAGRFSITPSPAAEDLSRFVLLLYDDAEREASRDPETERRMAAEYSAWASELGRDGRFVAGDPIHGEGRMLRRRGGTVEARPAGTEAGGEIVVGYFMIRARDHAEAVEIAKQCPHLGYDGGVLVRRVGFT